MSGNSTEREERGVEHLLNPNVNVEFILEEVLLRTTHASHILWRQEVRAPFNRHHEVRGLRTPNKRYQRRSSSAPTLSLQEGKVGGRYISFSTRLIYSLSGVQQNQYKNMVTTTDAERVVGVVSEPNPTQLCRKGLKAESRPRYA